MTAEMRELTIRCAPWSHEGVRRHRVLIADGQVRVWDPIAGYYTICHSLSARTQRRICAGLRRRTQA